MRSFKVWSAALGLCLTCATLPASFAQAAPSGARAVVGRERAAILDALRAKGEDKTRVFVVRGLRAEGDWAFARVEPQSRDGRQKFEPEAALLRKSGGVWRVVDQPCGEADCDEKSEIARIRKAFPQAPASLFDK